jgi:hypothetical protein
MTPIELKALVVDVLESFHVRKHYKNEAPDLHDHIEEALRARLDSGGHTSVTIKRCSGRGCPRVNLLGTSFWPDLELSLDGDPTIALEVKHVKRSFASALSAAIGQCLIYQFKYKYVACFILHRGPDDRKLVQFNEHFWAKMQDLQIPVVVRQNPDDS